MSNDQVGRAGQGGRATATYRANPGYALVAFADAGADLTARVGPAAADPSLFGLLMPRTAGDLTVKLVGHDTAHLVRALGAGGSPADLLPTRPTDWELADLVAARVLEVRNGGAFVTGLAALGGDTQPSQPADASRVAALSIAAIDAVAGMRLPAPDEIGRRLYAYNRVPYGAAWRRRWPDAAAVRGKVAALVAARQGATPLLRCAPHHAWSAWYPLRRPPRAGRPRPTYKLYVSSRPEHAFDALDAMLDVLLRQEEVPAWKVGGDATGLLRPDRLVVYFHARADLFTFAERLLPRLSGMPAQGVPFTTELTADGLLSWGVDPPPAPAATPTLADSWRTWVTDRLADALWQADQLGADPAAARGLALGRLAAVGVDTGRWTSEFHTKEDSR